MDEMAEQDKPYEERVLFLRRQQSQTTTQVNIFKGPLRVLRLCLLGILLPCILCIIVLHMRYRVYIHQMYPLATSDMRLLDNRVSSTWCQRQVIRANTTFNAFLLPEQPSMVAETKLLSMVRHLVLEDDTKEYWGFYLLRGSTVTLSSCVRWPGASLIVIRGHKHLHECAYIGDNSSEELDEIMEALAEGTYIRVNQTDDSAPSNTPQLMKRHRDDVQFHNPLHTKAKNHTLLNGLDMTDITDPKQFKSILDQLYAKTKGRQANVEGPKNHTHVHRNSTIAKGEQRNFKFEGQQENTANMSSEEVMRDVLNKLQKLGEKGNVVLDKINEKFRKGEMVNGSPTRGPVLSIRGRHYAKPPVKYDDNIDRASRRRRDLVLSQAMATDLNENDEENDAAIEEGLFPDGIADDRGTINETTLNDRSNSEFWSSFSSSEEALLNCAGLILNLPLTPHKQCRRQSTDQQIEEAYTPNTITYTVPTNGYYFFVYNSENEVQANYIRVRFNLHKKLYNVSNPVAVCRNTTDYCAFDLSFFSNEKLVMELPVKENEDLWNQEFVVVSECEPRTAIYLICVITVPILVILFAFQ